MPGSMFHQSRSVEFWADGIDGQTILEAKFVKKAKNSPFIAGSRSADFLCADVIG